MTIVPRWLTRSAILPQILHAETPKGPWGGSGDGGSGGGGSGGGSGGGPRNPWSVPPGGRRGNPQGPSALDEFLRKARSGGGGGGGFPGLPGGANSRTLWAIGAAILILAWLLVTSVHQIERGQRGVVTYFGRYAGTLEPGIRLTLPAPIAGVQKVDVQRFRTDNFPQGDGQNLTLTGDQNIVDLSYSVRWNIADPVAYVFQMKAPQDTVRAAVESAMRAVLATTTFQQAVGDGRVAIEQRVLELSQQILDSYRSGVRIQGVSIRQATAPVQIVDAFNDVIAAQQDATANVNKAQSYASQKVAQAQGAAAAFDRVYEQYRLAPEVTRRRMYYETMEAVLAKSNKTVVEAPGVVPYLPLDRARGAAAEPAQPQVQAGAGR